MESDNMSGNGLIPRVRRLINTEERLRTSPFNQLRRQMSDVSGDGGILKEVVQAGDGPPVPRNASVLMHYSGYLDYSHVPFETNTHLKFPRIMTLGRSVTLAGLELGLLTMKRGEFSRFLFEPQYAYGDLGCPPLIPGFAVVLYEVHVLDFLDSGRVDDFIELSPDEQNTAPLSNLLEIVNTVRSFGNHSFKQSRYENAKAHYKTAVNLLGNRETLSDVEREKVNTALLPLYLNLSFTELRLDRPHKALKYGNKALEIDSDSTKALFRCGQAYMELQEYQSAQECLISAQAKRPFDSDINNLLRKVTTCYRDSLDKEKNLCSKMFGDMRGT